MANERLSIIEFNTRSLAKRKKTLLSDLESFDEPVSTLPSDLMVKHKEKKESKKEMKKALKKEVIETSDYDDDGWATTLASFETPIMRKKTKNLFDGKNFTKKKKEKKKKAGELVNYKKEFAPELTILRNLQYENDKFIMSLQKKYDQMESSKSTARGIGKFTTDLIETLNHSRELSRHLVTDIIATKKVIAELDFKERKEFGNKLGDTTDAAAYASNFLKQMMSTKRVDAMVDSSGEIEDIDDAETMFDSISESLGDTGRSEDVEKYLKYENDNPVIKVIFHEDYEDSDDLDEVYDFVAYAEDGRVIPDYPLPKKTSLQVNKSTGISIDKYGNKYPTIFD